jgi:hypothetical protein
VPPAVDVGAGGEAVGADAGDFDGTLRLSVAQILSKMPIGFLTVEGRPRCETPASTEPDANPRHRIRHIIGCPRIVCVSNVPQESTSGADDRMSAIGADSPRRDEEVRGSAVLAAAFPDVGIGPFGVALAFGRVAVRAGNADLSGALPAR